MIAVQLVNEHAYLLETIDDCHNEGAACYGCPAFDQCLNHEALDETEA